MAPRAESTTTDAAPMLLVTCEHASNDVPPELRKHFRGKSALLRSHRGWDIGALEIAERIAAELSAPLMVGRWTRLVVDLNRSPTNRPVLSEITRELSDVDRQALLDRYHAPYRRAVEMLARRMIDGGDRVIHISVHTFTPVLNGKARAVDVGLLFDPKREAESAIARRWMRGIERFIELAEPATQGDRPPALRIRMNQPYRGVSDGLTTHLRSRFPADHYAGLELEVNQRFFGRSTAHERHPKPGRRVVLAAIVEALQVATTTRERASDSASIASYIDSHGATRKCNSAGGR